MSNYVFKPDRKTLRMLSLGGCITHDICSKVGCYDISHIGHLWRRPTIPLMSEPSSSVPDFPENFPDALSSYLRNDYTKEHAADIKRCDAQILVFDITRDIYCKVIELAESSFVIDPISVKGIMWNSDIVEENEIDKILNNINYKMDFQDNRYFDCWAYHFHKFSMVLDKFDNVILNQIYFTNEVASSEFTSFGDQEYVQKVNNFLDRCYSHIKLNYQNIAINAIPRQLMLTGVNVPWSGPMYTHFIEEATSFFAENIRKIILPTGNDYNDIVVKSIIQRARSYESIASKCLSIELAQEQTLQEVVVLKQTCLDAIAAREKADLQRIDASKAQDMATCALAQQEQTLLEFEVLKQTYLDAIAAREKADFQRIDASKARDIATCALAESEAKLKIANQECQNWNSRYSMMLNWSIAYHNSTAMALSWRITKPLRWLGFGRPRRPEPPKNL